MKIRDLVNQWESRDAGQPCRHAYQLELDVEAAARLAALAEMYPRRSTDELLAELVAAALEELEESLPYVPGAQTGVDELGDPIYEDAGPTPRFLALARRHRERLDNANASAEQFGASLEQSADSTGRNL